MQQYDAAILKVYVQSFVYFNVKCDKKLCLFVILDNINPNVKSITLEQSFFYSLPPGFSSK